MSNWDRFLNSFFNAKVAWDYLPKIADGFVLTVILALCVIATGLAAGLVLAVPVAATLKILAEELWLPAWRKSAAPSE